MARVLVLKPMIGNGVAYRVGEEVDWADSDVDGLVEAGAISLLERRTSEPAAPVAETIVETEVAGRKARTATTKPRQRR